MLGGLDRTLIREGFWVALARLGWKVENALFLTFSGRQETQKRGPAAPGPIVLLSPNISPPLSSWPVASAALWPLLFWGFSALGFILVTSSGVRPPWFKSWLCHCLAVWPWATDLPPLSLSYFFHKMR